MGVNQEIGDLQEISPKVDEKQFGRKDMSRRDFLGVVAAGLTGLALLKTVNKAKAAGMLPETETESNPNMIETKFGRFHVIVEKHNQRPIYAEELVKRGVLPIVHFVEVIASKSAAEIQQNDKSSDILYWESKGKNGQSFGQLIDLASLIYFAKNNVNVAYESLKYVEPKSLVGSVMSFAQEIVGGAGAQETHSKISENNPEDIILRFRNIMMSRKLIALSQYYSRTLGYKPDISMEIGEQHESGIRNLLSGTLDAFKELDRFSDDVLRKNIDINGGIDPFCKVMVIPTTEVLVGNKTERKIFIIDEELKNYLQKRFGGK